VVQPEDRVLEAGDKAALDVALADVRQGKGRPEQPD
jgi:hypothetical protein